MDFRTANLNYQKYLNLYSRHNIKVRPVVLKKIIGDAAREAKRNYWKLSSPKTMSEMVYVNAWIRDVVLHDIAENRKKIRSSYEYKPSIDFYLAFPTSLREKLKREINNSPLGQRKRIWINYGLDYRKIEKAFIRLTIQRNTWAKEKGYKNLIEEKLELYNINRKDYKYFISHTKGLIDYCYKQLPIEIKPPLITLSEFSKPCYICLSPNFPFANISEVIDYFYQECKNLRSFKKKLRIIFDRHSEMNHNLKDDTFEIRIERNTSFRHQALSLIHELTHVCINIENYERGLLPVEKGIYHQEKETLRRELSFLGKISPILYKTRFSDFLRSFSQVLFEIDLYNNPNQDLSKLYATFYNFCYPLSNQRRNMSYILDDQIVVEPLSILPHVVAQASVIREKLRDTEKC